MALSADDILGIDDVQIEAVDVPEWGGKVYVKGLTAAEADEYERHLVRMDDKGRAKLGNLANITAIYLVRCIVDENGKRMFKESDAAALGRKSSAALSRLYTVARRLSGGTEEATEAEAEGFGEAQDDVSSSASR